MRSLADVQREFARAIFLGTPPDVAFIPGPVSAEQACRIHRNTILGALVGALRLVYPAVNRLVGELFFDQAATLFAQQQPPSGACLATYGERFAEFLQSYEPAAALAYLPDMARLELVIDRVAQGPDAGRRYDLDGHVSVALPEGLRVLCLGWPVDLIKDALETGDDQALGRIDLKPSARWLAVWRIESRIAVKPLGPAAGIFLKALLDGAPADRALAAASVHASPQVAAHEIQRDIFSASFCRVATQIEEQQP